MAKEGSRFAAAALECQETAGEYRRSVAGPLRGGVAGTEYPGEAASLGNRRFSSSVRWPLQPRRRSGLPGGGLASGAGQSGGAVRWGRRTGTPLGRVRCRPVPRRAARRSQGSPVPAAPGAGADDPQGQRETPGLGHPHRPGPDRPGRRQVGARADLRGGLQAVFIWLPPAASSPGRHRRDPLPRLRAPELHLGAGGGHQGVLRRDRPHRPRGTGASPDRGPPPGGSDQGVPQERCAGRGRHRARHRQRHPPGRDP